MQEIDSTRQQLMSIGKNKVQASGNVGEAGGRQKMLCDNSDQRRNTAASHAGYSEFRDGRGDGKSCP
jgi:hypothetical protein